MMPSRSTAIRVTLLGLLLCLWPGAALPTLAQKPAEEPPGSTPEDPSDDASTQAPLAFYVTFERDPTTSMVVHWLSLTEHDRPSTLSYRLESSEDTPWRTAEGQHEAMPAGEPADPVGRRVHTVRLSELQPASVYQLRPVGEGPVYRVRTLSPDPQAPLRLVVGGDVWKHRHLYDPMTKRVAEAAPDLAVVGGDLAYANGVDAGRWVSYLAHWTETAVTPEGLNIPMVVAIGNHEVIKGDYGRPKEEAPFFYSLFAFPTPEGYGVIDLGEHLSLIVLDSGHTNKVLGQQSGWLWRTLQDRQGRAHLLCVYHVPAFPSHRWPYNLHNRQVRTHWSPIMERFGVDLAFEHHDHAYKRTWPIKDNRPDPHGVVYLGDGAWGSIARSVDPPGEWYDGGRWYLAKSGEKNHVFIVDIQADRRSVQAIDPEGVVFDQLDMVEGEPLPVPPEDPRAGLVWAGLGFLLVGVASLVGYGLWLWRGRGRSAAPMGSSTASTDASVASATVSVEKPS